MHDIFGDDDNISHKCNDTRNVVDSSIGNNDSNTSNDIHGGHVILRMMLVIALVILIPTPVMISVVATRY